MRLYNRDGSSGGMAANPLRCVAKYLFDNKITGENMSIETISGIKSLSVNSFNDKASSVSVNLGQPTFDGQLIPSKLDGEVIDRELTIGKDKIKVTLVNVGNPHCVVFLDKVDEANLEALGQQIAESGYFSQDIYVELVRVVNSVTVKMRVWDSKSGELWSCGTAAAAAAVAAIKNGGCKFGEIITVKLKGGDLFIKYDESGVELDGAVKKSFEGTIEI